MWGRKRRAFYAVDPVNPDAMQDGGKPHFLDKLKAVVDDVLGPAPLHVCIEAANPRMLGRSSDLLMHLMLSTNFGSSPPSSRNGIQIHFIPDRLSVPALDGHVLAIGGPRSDVISRIAMEYEMNYSDRLPFYRRYTSACFKMRYTHINRRDYDDRVLTDIESLDETALEIIHHYYNDINKMRDQVKANPRSPSKDIYLFSANRSILSAPKRSLPSLSIDLTALQESGVSILARPVSDFVLYDHFVETLLPNVFSKGVDQHGLIIMHGLRNLGTFAGAGILDDPAHLETLRSRLEQFKLRRSEGSAKADQRCWSVIRPLEYVFEQHSEAEAIKLISGLGYGPIREMHGESLAIQAQNTSEALDEAKQNLVEWSRVERFQAEIRRQHYDKPVEKRRRSAVKFDQIDENQILDAMSLPRDQHMRRHQIYVLGCFEAKKTVFTQQTRAMTLIHALFKAGKIGKGRKICIIGGGISGMAAAVAAAETGTRVVLLEKEPELVPVIDRKSQRYLHPRFYDWPEKGCEHGSTDFPLPALNWTAGRAETVISTLVDQFEAYQARRASLGDYTDFSVYREFPVQMLLFDRQNRKHIVANWHFGVDEDGEMRAVTEPRSIQEQLERRRRKHATATEADLLAERRMKASAYIAHLQKMGEGDHGYPARRDPRASAAEEYNAADDPWSIVDCDVVVFATGFGAEIPREFNAKVNPPMPEDLILNKGYWTPDETGFGRASEPLEIKEDAESAPDRLFVVSGSGDGALVDILRLCIENFDHERLVNELNALLSPRLNGAVWANQSDVLVYGDELSRLFESDDFKLVEGEKDRLAQIDQVMSGFDIDAFLDRLDVKLNPVQVYNVANVPQPFWPASCTAHRLLVWCLFKKGRVRFIEGAITGYEADEAQKALHIRRKLAGKTRRINPSGVVIRHGVGQRHAGFLKIQGVLDEESRSHEDIANDGRRLVALLRLSNTLHPETEKFFRHTIKHLK